MGTLLPETPLEQIHDVSPRFLKYLERLGLRTVRDLLYHFPTRYEDFSEIRPIGDLAPGERVTVRGVIRDAQIRRTWQRHMTIVEATIEDETGALRAVWFNQPYVKNALRPGRVANFSGKIVASENDVYLSHPTYEFLYRNEKEETRHTGRLVPIYPETHGLTSKGIRFLTQPILKNLEPLEEWFPEETRRIANLPELNDALHAVHFPKTLDEALAAKRRFAFEDLFLLQIMNLEDKRTLLNEQAYSVATPAARLKEIIIELPFTLTPSQQRSLEEITADIGKETPMNRLLQGDVGSGKTVVAAIAALLTAEAGYQTAFMAPTEVLARQHFKTFEKLFAAMSKHLHPAIGFLAGNEAKIIYEGDLEITVPKKEFTKRVTAGQIAIVLGTHALIQKTIVFKNLALAVVDEQHRFGVKQRQALLRGGHHVPHFLSMSATPIPRTLMLTVFGDLDASIIDELPVGRKEIITKIVSPENRAKAYGVIRGQINKGRQVFVICPRIEPSDTQEENKERTYSMKQWEVKSVREEYEKLSKSIFPDLTIAMLHGQLKPKDKEKIMNDFKTGATDVLVSTSVIEVGVDVPNATIIMIEGSDRFGLAQLYQFRGRVGRGEHQSFCFLFTDSSARSTAERLKAIVEAKNGFELAERDLKLRGPGEFLGQKQTGIPDIAMRGLQDMDLVRSSRTLALSIIQKDPALTGHPALKEKLAEFRARLHQE